MKYLFAIIIMASSMAIADADSLLSDFDNRLKTIPATLTKDSINLAHKFVEDAKAAKSSCSGERKLDCEFSLENRMQIVLARIEDYKPKAEHNTKADEERASDPQNYGKCKPKIEQTSKLEASRNEKVVELRGVQSQASIKKLQREIEKTLQQIDENNAFLKKNNCGRFIYW